MVIVHVPDETKDGVRLVGDWQAIAEKAHKAFVTMGVDAIAYINHYDLSVSPNALSEYSELFTRRKVKNLIFLIEERKGYSLSIVPFNNKPTLMDNGSVAFQISDSDLYSVLLQTGIEIRRADFENENYLIPAKPNYEAGISIVEKAVLQNYPGILRRTKLSVERFAEFTVPKEASAETQKEIAEHNQLIQEQNEELAELTKRYPYEFELIDPMSDEDLLRSRRQFVLRSVRGKAATLRSLLDFTVREEETDFVSLIPIMPDQTKAKPISRDALVYKFYVRQNISKNIHIGEWDADLSWQDALSNMIGHLIQEHTVDQ